MSTTATLALSQPEIHVPQPVVQPQRIIIRHPQTESEYEAMFRLRYEVYTHEGFNIPGENNPTTLDRDHYDARSVHWIALRERRIIGTMRIIPYSSTEPFIIEEFFNIEWPPGVKPQDCVEGSRAVIPLSHRTGNALLGLLIAVYDWLTEQQIPYFIAIMKTSLRSTFERGGVSFQPLGREPKANCPLPRHYLFGNDDPAAPVLVHVPTTRQLFTAFKQRLGKKVTFC